MAERRIGLIPYAISTVRAGEPEECAVLVTDRRTIIAFEQARATGLRTLLKRSFEDPTKEIARVKNRLDLGTIDIDALASMNANVSVPHSSIERLRMKKGRGGCSISVDYTDQDGRKLAAYAELKPSSELMKLRRREGRTKEEIRNEYGEKAQEVFKRALPPVAFGKAEWFT